MTPLWPRKILPPQQPMFHFRAMNVSGPIADSASDVVSGDAGFWVATYGNVVVTTRERVLMFNALAAMLEGRLNPVLVPYCSRPYQPVDDAATFDELPHDDDTMFADGTGYVGSGTRVLITADRPERAVTGTVDVTFGEMLMPGQVFSFGEFLYRLKFVSYTTPTRANIKWSPPLREAVVAGAELNFTDPVCRMRLATDDEMMLQLDLNKRGFPTVNFVEDLVT